jgi:2',3'-cyclic-nucleotide 2'-phosphodiesterase (5'-nucleotidase family)
MKGVTDPIMQACIGIGMKAPGRVASVLMKALRYDAMTMGNHELDFDADHVRIFIRQAGFLIKASSIHERETGGYVLALTSFSSWVH